jgi:hypothetical protein
MPCQQRVEPGKGVDGLAIAAWVLPGQITAALIEPVEHLNGLVGLQTVKRVVPGRIEFDPAFRPVNSPLSWTAGAGGSRRADPANKAHHSV